MYVIIAIFSVCGTLENFIANNILLDGSYQ